MKIGCLACFAYILAVQAEEPALLIGTADGSVVAAPQDWPAKAGTWNAKGARYHPASRRLVFETFRKDIVGGSIVAATGEIKAPGVRSYFVAGPGTGTEIADGTTILYIAGRDGGESYAIGERDCMDGVDGLTMYMAAPSTTGTPQRPLRQRGASMYANRNKDLAAWHPNGKWIIAAVEMPRHALTHDKGNGETGLFNNLWAISADGKIWVQLTRFETTWRYFDPVAMLPYAAADRKNNPVGAWYASKDHTEPYAIFSASAPGEPPPASGIMRPVCGHHEVNGRTPVVWAERVGLSPGYVWGGTLQLAMADIVFVDGIPTLVNYRRSLTPTPAAPAGEGLWANRDGNTVIGAGYEAWDISPDDTEILFASDVFFSGSHTAGNWPYGRKTRAWTQAFPDVAAWNWEIPSLENITAYRPGVYTYKDNAGSW